MQMGQITHFFPQSIFHIANIQIINDSIKYYFKYLSLLFSGQRNKQFSGINTDSNKQESFEQILQFFPVKSFFSS